MLEQELNCWRKLPYTVKQNKVGILEIQQAEIQDWNPLPGTSGSVVGYGE